MGLNIPIVSFVVTFGYMLVFGGFLIAYIAYNRAFSRKGMTPDMLPDSWSNEKKQEYIEDGARRMKRSRWLLILAFAIFATLAFDIIELYMFPVLRDILGIAS